MKTFIIPATDSWSIFYAIFLSWCFLRPGSDQDRSRLPDWEDSCKWCNLNAGDLWLLWKEFVRHIWCSGVRYWTGSNWGGSDSPSDRIRPPWPVRWRYSPGSGCCNTWCPEAFRREMIWFHILKSLIF